MENYGQAVLILGRSGSGKTTSLETLNPLDTLIIMSQFKPLPFNSWAKNYVFNGKYQKGKGLIWVCDNFEGLKGKLDMLENPNIDIPFKNIIFDDFQYYSQRDVFSKADEKGFDKFIELGMHIENSVTRIINLSYMRGKNIAILWHSNTETLAEEKGTLVQTSSKFIDEKFLVEGSFSTVLKTEIVEGEYRFKTNSTNNLLSVKSPKGVFDLYIDNDLNYVFEMLDKNDKGLIEKHKNELKDEKETK